MAKGDQYWNFADYESNLTSTLGYELLIRQLWILQAWKCYKNFICITGNQSKLIDGNLQQTQNKDGLLKC